MSANLISERSTVQAASDWNAKYDKGGAKFDGDKLRYDLLPMEALRRLALHYERGAHKYTDENWRKGIPLRRYAGAALRHLSKFMHGWRDEDHLAAVMWNVAGIIETQEMIRRGLLPEELDNLPDWTGGK